LENKFITTSTNWNIQLNSSKANWADKNSKNNGKDVSFTKTKMNNTKSNWNDHMN